LLHLGSTLLLLNAIQLGLKQRQRHLFVLMLAPFAPALGGDAGRQMGKPDAALGLVLVLATGASAAEGVAFQVFRAAVNLARDLDPRDHLDSREGGMAPCVGIKRTDADQAIDAGLALKMAVRVVADHAQCRTADAGFIIAQLVNDFRLVAVLLCPTAIKA